MCFDSVVVRVGAVRLATHAVASYQGAAALFSYTFLFLFLLLSSGVPLQNVQFSRE